MSKTSLEIPLPHEGPGAAAAAAAGRAGARPLLSLLAVNGGMMRIIAGLVSFQLVSRVLSGFSILLSVWLFAPADFVRFGTLLAALTLASAVQFLRYDYVIVSANGLTQLCAALRLTAFVGVAVWLVLAAGAWIAVDRGIVGADIAGLFLLALAARGLSRIMGRLGVRDGEFKRLGQATLALSACQPVVVVTAWLLGVNGAVAMVLSDIIGNLVSALWLGWQFRSRLRGYLRAGADIAGIWRMAHAWSSLPLVNLPSSLLAVSFATVPVMVVLNVAEAEIAGHFALAFRLLDVPAQILAAAISPIAMNRFTRRQGQPRQHHDPELALWLIIAVLAVFGGITLAAPMIEPWLAGTGWRGFTAFIPLVALFQGGVALTLPLLELAGMQHKQRDLFVLQLLTNLAMGLMALTIRDWKLALVGFGILAGIQAVSLLLPLLCWPKETVRDLATKV
jgi:hypothetical protein